MALFHKEHLLFALILAKYEVHLGKWNQGIFFGGDEHPRAIYLLKVGQIHIVQIEIGLVFDDGLDVFEGHFKDQFGETRFLFPDFQKELS